MESSTFFMLTNYSPRKDIYFNQSTNLQVHIVFFWRRKFFNLKNPSESVKASCILELVVIGPLLNTNKDLDFIHGRYLWFP